MNLSYQFVSQQIYIKYCKKKSLTDFNIRVLRHQKKKKTTSRYSCLWFENQLLRQGGPAYGFKIKRLAHVGQVFFTHIYFLSYKYLFFCKQTQMYQCTSHSVIIHITRYVVCCCLYFV